MKHLFLATLLLLSIPTLAQKATRNDSVDREIKKTHIQMELQKQKLERDLKSSEDSALETQPETDFSNHAPADVSPVEWGEQQEQLKTESMMSDVRSLDPAQLAEQEVYKKQHQEITRTRYRKEIQRQFEENLNAAGIRAQRNIAEEIKNLEELQKNSTK